MKRIASYFYAQFVPATIFKQISVGKSGLHVHYCSDSKTSSLSRWQTLIDNLYYVES